MKSDDSSSDSDSSSPSHKHEHKHRRRRRHRAYGGVMLGGQHWAAPGMHTQLPGTMDSDMFLTWQPQHGPTQLQDMMRSLQLQGNPAPLPAATQHMTTTWSASSGSPSSYAHATTTTQPWTAPQPHHVIYSTAMPGFPDSSPNQPDPGYTVLLPTAGPAGPPQPTSPTAPYTVPTFTLVPDTTTSSSNGTDTQTSFYATTGQLPPMQQSLVQPPVPSAWPPSTNSVGNASPAQVPLTPLPVCLTCNPAVWECPPGSPGVAAPCMSQLYDSSTGLVLEVAQGNTAVLQELAAAGHVLQPVAAACCHRVAELQAAVNSGLLSQRNRILAQQARVALRAGELRSAAAGIAQRTRALMKDMLDRLTVAESAKLGQLSAAQSSLAAELAQVEECVSRVVAACHTRHGGPDRFLGSTSVLLQECHQLSSRPIMEDLPAHPDQLPAECDSLSELTRNNSALTKLLRVKDAMIFQLLQEREQLVDQTNRMAAEFSAEVEALERQLRQRQHEQQTDPAAAGQPAGGDKGIDGQ